jgi:ankyrin repeat protein
MMIKYIYFMIALSIFLEGCALNDEIDKIKHAIKHDSIEEIRAIFNLEATSDARRALKYILKNNKNTDEKALELAIRFGSENLVSEIIKRSDSDLNLNNYTTLVAKRNNEKIIELFIANKAQFKYLHQLEKVLSNTQAVKLLIEKNGLDININDKGTTALHMATRQKGYNIETLKYLLMAGADVNAQDHFGATPLMWAADVGNLSAIKVLLDAKADKNITDIRNHTAFTRAWGDKNIQNFIQNYI